jgi:hypothetical protein
LLISIYDDATVDDERIDLRAALQELADETTEIGPHVGWKRLIAYRLGKLPAAEREALQEHLSLCARCTGRLRELRDFEAAAGAGDAAGPKTYADEAWEALIERLPRQRSAIRPIAGAVRRETPRQPRRSKRLFYVVAAALLLAVLGLSLWGVVTAQQSRRRLTLVERRLAERESALAAAQRSLADAERRLATAQKSNDQLAAQIAELRREPQEPPPRAPIVIAAADLAVTLAPRFALRGQEPAESDFLRGQGAVNAITISQPGDRFTVALPLPDRPASEILFELIDPQDKTLWKSRRPSASLLGDAGTSITIRGLSPGRYRLRVDGWQPELAEYILQIDAAEPA